MALLYTTTDAIARRLNGWATVNQTAGSFGASEIDSELIEQIAEQVEARANQVLSQRFQMPLLLSHLEISSCVEKLIICELIGQLYAGQEPSESGGYGALMCAKGSAELKALSTAQLAGEVLLGGALLTAASPISRARSLPPLTEGQTTRIRW
jgi:hypothetical protein